MTWDALAEADPRHAAWAEPGYEASAAEHLERLRPVLDRARPDGLFLDWGCGPGRLTVPAAEAYPSARFVGYDPTPGMLAAAAPHPRIAWVGADGPLDHWKATFDGAWCVLVLQHLRPFEQVAAIGALARLLRPGAWLVAQFSILTGAAHSGPLSWPREPDSVRAVLATCFEPTSITLELDARYPWVWAYARKPA
jgi:SAM-dependent methyltransferase